MKKILLLSLFLLSFCIIEAAHLTGGYMSYLCLGNNEYKITMTVVRDCNTTGADFDSGPNSTIPATVSIYNGNQVVSNLILDAPSVSQIQLNESNHPCPGNLNLCVEKGVYEFIAVLSSTNDLYTISYQRCCRTPSISNILLPEQTGFTLTIDIPTTAQSFCNSSPIFTKDQATIVCVNESMDLDFSSIDPNGDELIYSLCSPLLGGGLGGQGYGSATDLNGVAPDPDAPAPYINVDFLSPNFNTQAPLGQGSFLELNQQTGIMTIGPNLIGQFVFGICVQEFRNGELLSTTIRDIQINSVDCDPNTSVCFPTSVSNKSKTNEIELFPNPTDSDFTISSEINIEQVKIYNINGKLLETRNENIRSISLGNRQSGVYLIVIQDESGQIYHNKVLKI